MQRPATSLIAVVVCSLPASAGLAAEAPLAGGVGASRGLCVLVGEQWGPHAVELAAETELLILIQSADPDEVRTLQELLDRQRLLGTRIYVCRTENKTLCLADDLATVVVLAPTAVDPPDRGELLRVLHPRGRLLTEQATIVKPVPAGTGEWTHPYHGPDNNPLAEDSLARAPYLTKFLAEPWYGPMPEITLSAGGRLFKAFGHLAFKQREWPVLGKLIALNAYSGVPLWQRDMEPGFMIHRNTIVATDETVYLADHRSCKLIDAATGELRDEIVVPPDISDGPVWKWMTIQNGTLYALVGEAEPLHTVHRGTRGERGWPWTTVKSTYGDRQQSWGFGRTLFAMELDSRRLLWSHRETDPVDSRATAMSDGRIFLYSHPKSLAAIDAATGKELWRNSSAGLLDAIGDHDPADNPRLGYATSSYLKSTPDALFFAGPQRRRLAAVSATDGELLWAYPEGNMQLVIRDDGLYAMGRMETSKKFEPLTGAVLADLQCFRGNCTRATGTADSIFARGYRHTGTLRFDLHDGQPHRLPSMRPACQDGVLASNGQLYWGPWMCDCNHSLVGVISLTSAGDFPFDHRANNEGHLTVAAPVGATLQATPVDERDWPTYRADNSRSSSTAVDVPRAVRLGWYHQPQKSVNTLPAVSVGPLVFLAGSDGLVRALDAESGDTVWSYATGGRVFYPPAVQNDRLYVGSADGRVHTIEAATGRPLWQFRAGPTDRRIPVYGRLSSTWPVASGVLVDNGIAFAAAGIANHDGTWVYGLNAETGEIVWQNSTSHNLTGGTEVTGVSVQGHLLLHDGTIYLAGGNVVSPARYDAADGRCLNRLEGASTESLDTHWQMQRSSRGSELFLNVASGQVVTGGRMLYSPQQDGIPSRYSANYVSQASRGDVVIRASDRIIQRVDLPEEPGEEPTVLWKRSWFTTTDAIVVAGNAVVVAGQMPDVAAGREVVPAILALDTETGTVRWSHRLPQRVVNWGVAVDRRGKILVTLGNGDVVCLTADG